MKESTNSESSLHRIALAVEYDGSAYSGWQRQLSPELATVQSELESALSQVANLTIVTTCAGRTDAGVHASCQIVHFDTPIDRGDKAWTQGVNSLLPPSIRVIWSAKVGADFHARFSAIARRYHYLLKPGRVASAIHAGKLTHVRGELDLNAMNQAAQYLLGEQDFSAFRAAGCQSKTPYREVIAANLQRRSELIVFDIQANAFLQHMVRNIVGALLEVGRGQRDPEWIRQLLDGKDRTQSGIAAPPDGLYLVQVDYPATFALPATSRIPLLASG